MGCGKHVLLSGWVGVRTALVGALEGELVEASEALSPENAVVERVAVHLSQPLLWVQTVQPRAAAAALLRVAAPPAAAAAEELLCEWADRLAQSLERQRAEERQVGRDRVQCLNRDLQVLIVDAAEHAVHWRTRWCGGSRLGLAVAGLIAGALHGESGEHGGAEGEWVG